MGKSKHFRNYNRTGQLSVSRCECRWCFHNKGKKRGCALSECACPEERAEAYRRERESKKAANMRRRIRETDYGAGCDE